MYCLDNSENIELAIADKTESYKLQLLQYVDNQSNLTEKGKKVLIEIERYLIQKTTTTVTDIETDITENIKKYISIFPAGIVEGKALRTSPKAIMPRIKWFLNLYPEYTWDTIFNATKKYIESIDNMTYCKTASYFIKKEDKNRTVISLLADWCEAIKDIKNEEENNPIRNFNKLA